jgi:hypothetical protein
MMIAVDDAAEDVATELVRTHQVMRRRTLKPVRGGGHRVDGPRVSEEVRHPEVGGHCGKDHDKDPDQRRNCEPVAPQPAQRIAEKGTPR